MMNGMRENGDKTALTPRKPHERARKGRFKGDSHSCLGGGSKAGALLGSDSISIGLNFKGQDAQREESTEKTVPCKLRPFNRGI